MHRHGQPGRTRSQIRPPLLIKLLLLLRTHPLPPGLPLPHQCRIPPQPQEIRAHPDQPRTTRPLHHIRRAPTAGDECGLQHPLVGQLQHVLRGLEADVPQALHEEDLVLQRVAALLVQERFEQRIQREEAREAEGGAEVGHHEAEGEERGGFGGQGAGGEFDVPAEDAGEPGDEGRAAGGLRVQVGEEVEGVVEGGAGGGEAGGGFDRSVCSVLVGVEGV